MNKIPENTKNSMFHLKSPELAIMTGIHNKCQDYFLAESCNLGMESPMIYVDSHLMDDDYIKEKLSISTSEENYGFSISILDSCNKYSLDYCNCTGAVAIGRSKKTGKNISFLTHQNPRYFLSDEKASLHNGYTKKSFFEKSFRDSISELKKYSEKGTIDIVILGGNSNADFREYKESIDLLGDVVYSEMGFYPTIVGGPTINHSEDFFKKGIYLNTKDRRIHYYKKYGDVKSNIMCTSDKIEGVLENLGLNQGFIDMKTIIDKIKKILKF